MKARKFVLTSKQSRQHNQLKAKKTTARKKVNTRLRKMSSRQNKEKHGRQKKTLANSLGAVYASYFKAVLAVFV